MMFGHLKTCRFILNSWNYDFVFKCIFFSICSQALVVLFHSWEHVSHRTLIQLQISHGLRTMNLWWLMGKVCLLPAEW